MAPAPHQGYSPLLILGIFPLGLWDGGSFFGAAVPVGYFLYTEAARKFLPHTESGGRSWPQPPTKAIAHPSFWAFSAGGLWDGGLRALVFGRSYGWDIPRANGGRSQCLGPFRVPRTMLAPAPHQGYSPPLVLGIFRWGVVGRGPSGARFWARPCPQPIFGTRRPLAKSRPIPSPADEVGPSPPPRL